jgi:hypothetical protein
MKNEIPVNENIVEFVPAIRMLLSGENLKIARLSNNSLNSSFCNDLQSLEKACRFYKPSDTSTWDGRYIYLKETSSPEKIIAAFIAELSALKSKKSTPPKIIIVKNYGVLAVEDTSNKVVTLLDDFEENLKNYSNSLNKLGNESHEMHAKNKKSTDLTSGAFQNKSVLNQKICVVT